MLNKVVNFFIILGIISIMSCASTGGPSASSGGGYYEDLSEYRPDYTAALDTMTVRSSARVEGDYANIEPQYDVTDEVDMLLDSIKILKQGINTVDGYAIQVYTGISREMANEAKLKVYTTLPDSRPEIIYNQPNFKVKVGRFHTRREALNTFAQLKKVFPAAIIIPERIPIGEND